MKVIGIKILPDGRSMLIIEHDPRNPIADNERIPDILDRINIGQDFGGSFLPKEDKINYG
jgi:hypothetical protein